MAGELIKAVEAIWPEWASLAHLELPAVHRKHARTTNLIERGFEEERRRAKVIPRFRTEKESLKLVFAALWQTSERWRRMRFSERERRQLQRYRDGTKVQKTAAQSGGENGHRGTTRSSSFI